MSGDITYVIPSFNAGSYLLTAVQSCLDQSWDGVVQVIVVDDGSTDESVSNLALALGHLPNLKIISQVNQGESAAVNAGVRLVATEFVCVLSADDAVDTMHARTILTKMSLSDAVVMYPDWVTIDHNGKPIRRNRTLDYSRKRLWEHFQCLPGPGAVIRVGAISYPLRSGQFRFIDDYVQWLRLSLQGNFRRVPISLAFWRSHSSQATRTGADLIRSERYDLLRSIATGDMPLPSEVDPKKMAAGLEVLHLLEGFNFDVTKSEADWAQILVKMAQRALREPLNLGYGILKSIRRKP